MLRLMGGGGEMEMGMGMWGAAGDDGKGRAGEKMERLGGYRRGHTGRACVWQCWTIYVPLLSTHASRHGRSAHMRPDGWAAGRILILSCNALVSLDANIFAGLTSLR